MVARLETSHTPIPISFPATLLTSIPCFVPLVPLLPSAPWIRWLPLGCGVLCGRMRRATSNGSSSSSPSTTTGGEAHEPERKGIRPSFPPSPSCTRPPQPGSSLSATLAFYCWLLPRLAFHRLPGDEASPQRDSDANKEIEASRTNALGMFQNWLCALDLT